MRVCVGSVSFVTYIDYFVVKLRLTDFLSVTFLPDFIGLVSGGSVAHLAVRSDFFVITYFLRASLIDFRDFFVSGIVYFSGN